MKKRVLLHIGFPKTGTTSIQSFCFFNRDTLLKHGIAYPDLSLADPGEPSTASHKALMAALLTEPPERLAVRQADAIADTDAMFAEFGRNGPPTLMLSHETLSQRNDLDFARLRAWLAPHDVKILAFVRTFDEWLESLYVQNLRGDGMVAKPFRETRLGAIDAMRFLHPLRRFRTELPRARIKLLSYDRFRGGGLIGRVLRFAGVRDGKLLNRAAARRHANASPPTADVMFGAYLSAAFQNRDLTPLTIAALDRARQGGAVPPLDALPFRFMSPELKQQARDLYRQDLPALRQEFGLIAEDPGPVAPNHLAYADSLSRDQFQALLAVAAPHLPPDVRSCPPSLFDLAAARFA